MPIDVLASVRSSALVAVVAASFTSPIVVKSDAFATMTGRAAHKAEPTERLVAGGVEFAMPVSWGRLGSTAASGEAEGVSRIGTVLSGLCPGGSKGATCADGTQVTFVAYSGKKGHELPPLDDFEHELDAKLAKEFPGFAKADSQRRPGADGIRWLDYRFSWRHGRVVVQQRFAAFRHHDGSGVVAMVTGAGNEDHAKAIEAFLASGHAAVEGKSGH